MVDPGRLVDRGRELGLLEKAWSSRPGLAVVYGRRRVGKTRLLVEWLRGLGAPGAYYQAGMWSHGQNLMSLAEALEEQLGLRGFSRLSFPGLDTLLETAARLHGGDAAVVIDELTYWLRVAPGVAAELQRFIDHVLPSTRMLLVVSSSTVGVMERAVASGPLYGRASARLRMGEPSPWCIPFFAPGLGPGDLVRLYSLLGGVPHYLRLVRDAEEPLEAFLRLFGPEGLLSDEPLFVAREEFRDPHPYLSLLRALARGPRRLSEAAQEAGLPSSHASRYVRVLEEIGLVEKEQILFTRRSLYRVVDKPLRAWLSVLEPVWGLLAENPEAGREKARALAEAQAALTWEELARSHAVSTLAPGIGLTPANAGRGRLIHRGHEVDTVIIDEENETILAVEAKWGRITSREAARQAARTRAALAAALPARLQGYRVLLALYAREAEAGAEAHWDAVVTPGELPWRRGCV